MNSHPPKSGTDPDKRRTDFSSLMSESIPAPLDRNRTKKAVATDFKSLKKSLGEDYKKSQHRTPTDWLVEILTPLMIFIMVLSAMQFLLNVRLIYTENFHRNLQFATFFFVLGIVSINRLVVTEGSEESIIYIFFFGGVAFLYTVAMTSMWGTSSFAKGFLDGTWVASFINMFIVCGLWWATNRLMHECCIDENTSGGDVGIITGTAQQIQKSIKRDPKVKLEQEIKKIDGGSVIEHMDLEAIDPSEWKEAKDTGPKKQVALTYELSSRHPGISIIIFAVPVMILFAIGQRVLLAGGHRMDVEGMRYVIRYTASSLSLLMLTSLSGLREFFRERHINVPGGLGIFWIGLSTIMLAAVLIGALTLPLPSNPSAAHIEHEYDRYSRTQILPKFEESDISAAEELRQLKYMRWIGHGVLTFFGLLLIYGLLRLIDTVAAHVGQNRDRFPRFIVRFFNWIDLILTRFLKVPSFSFRRTKRIHKVSRSIATCTKYVNPMADADESARMTVADHIELTYDALCALAYDLGVPRNPDETPYEYIRSFPKQLSALKEEAVELTNMYVTSAYSTYEYDKKIFDNLRRFWITYERVRSQMLH